MIVIFRIEQIPGRQCQLHIRPADRDTETGPQVKQLRPRCRILIPGNPVLVGNILVFHIEAHPLFLPGKRIPQRTRRRKTQWYMLVQVISIDIFTSQFITEMQGKIYFCRDLSSGKQGFRSCITINLSGMGKDGPLPCRFQVNIIAEPAGKRRYRDGKESAEERIGNIQLPSPLRPQVRITLLMPERTMMYPVGCQLIRTRQPETVTDIRLQ